ncbi:MAG: PAS domain S-box protein [Halorhabdus sp.]
MDDHTMDPREEIVVLHVDDEPGLAEMAAEFLEREDDRLVVDTARNADDALDTLTARDIDCVVSDYDMPGRDGIALLEAVRADDPELPFILYTGKGSEEIASEAISAGVTDYLQKGTDQSQYAVLANRVTNAVETYRNKKRAETMQRIQAIQRDVDQHLVRAQTREEIETAVCDVISAADPYRLVWIGTDDADTIQCRACAGEATGYVDAITTAPSGDREPARQALQHGKLTAVQSMDADGSSWQAVAREYGFSGATAVPIVHDAVQYGVLAVYCGQPQFFDERERDLLVKLSDDIAHAIHRVESETALREQRANLRVYERAIESSNDLLAGIDTEYTLIFANERYREFHGVAADEIGERSLPDVLGSTWDDEIKAREDRVLDGEVLRYEVERTASDGTQRTFSVQDYPLVDDDGTILGVVGSMRDITERKERERERKRLKERLDLAVEAAGIGVWDWNVQTDEVQYNDQWARMLGYDLEEIEPHLDAWKRRVHPNDRPAVTEKLRAHLDGETEQYECDHRMRTADGDWKRIRDVGRVIERDADGEPVRAVGVHLDVDDRGRHGETSS